MISLVAAMTKQRVIGVDDKLPWHIADEVTHFRAIIQGKTVIMGRNTYEVMKGHLETSHNIIITHSEINSPNTITSENIEDALAKAKGYGVDTFVIGGQSIFEQAIGLADTMQLSFIKKDYEGNKFFPKFDEKDWTVASRENFPEFEYVIYKRIAPK